MVLFGVYLQLIRLSANVISNYFSYIMRIVLHMLHYSTSDGGQHLTIPQLLDIYRIIIISSWRIKPIFKMMFEILCFTFIVVLISWVYTDNFKSKRPPGKFWRVFCLQFNIQRKYVCMNTMITGPLRLPLIGTILQLGVDKRRPQYETFRSISKKYGPISSIELGLYPGGTHIDL